MAKKKGKVIQMPLSPENYIRTRVRNLPIGDCYITKDWDKGGMANIFIVRNHTNGNKTVGMFLADIYCLGVKDTFYLFNIPESEFLEILDKNSEEGQEMIKADYTLAHNVIYGSIEFAAEYGFKPHKDFNLTKYILVEDDNVELMDIDFGINGKPAIFVGKEKHPANIIAQLDKTAGKGNYYITYEEDADYLSDENDTSNEDFDDDKDDDDFDYEDDEDDDMNGKPMKEWTAQDYKDILEGKKKTSIENTALLMISTYLASLKKKESKLIYKLADDYQKWNVIDYEEWEEKQFSSKEEKDIWNELNEKIDESAGNALPVIEKAIIEYPESFHICNIKGFCLEELGLENELLEYSEELYRNFPDEVMALCNLLIHLKKAGRNTEAEMLISKTIGLFAMFPQRKELSVTEVLNYMTHLILYYLNNKRIHEAIAGVLYLLDFEFKGKSRKQAGIIFASAMDELVKYISMKHNINLDELREEE
ncbi:MAG: hypothetical protein V1904_10250 [Bacteroidota bacterium]